MLPIMIPFDPATLMTIAKGLLFLNPMNFFFIGAMIILWFTLKTVTAKLAFLGASLLISSIIAYVVYQNDKKHKKVEKKQIDLSDDFFSETPEQQAKSEEKELMLSRIFKK